MTYNFNGKALTIPDAEIEKSMKCLELTKDEAIQLWLEDNDYVVNEEVEELTAKAKANKTERVQASAGKRKKTMKERKVDAEKGRLLGDIKALLEGLGADIHSVKTETEVAFAFNGNEYTVKLTKHRPPKA